MKTNRVLLFVLFITVLTFSSFINIDKNQTIEKFVVVLDAGHGGHDPGNMGNGHKEKDISLNISFIVFILLLIVHLVMVSRC